MTVAQPWTANQDDHDDDDSSCSIDTQDALLDLLGLSTPLQSRSCTSDTKFPPLSSIVVMDEEEEEQDETSVSNPKVIPVDLPPKCSRYGHAPQDCVAVCIPDFYTPAECQRLLRLGQTTGFQYITQASHLTPDGTSYTVSLQNPNPHKLAVLEDKPTIAGIWHRLVHSHNLFHTDWMTRFQKRTGYGAPVGLNPRVRVLQYDASDNDRFEAHFDATTQVKAADGSTQTSRLTVLLYLNTGGGMDFEGGGTLYLDAQIGGDSKTSSVNVSNPVTVVPKQGTLVVFEHDLFHAGAPLVWGTKHVMRTDILFDVQGNAHAENGRCDQKVTDSRDTEHGISSIPLHQDNQYKSKPTNTVLDLCQEMQSSPHDQSILQDMGLLDMTLDSFLVPGIAVLTELMADGGVDGPFLKEFLKVAQERVLDRTKG